MPNWCNNRLTVSGPEDRVEDFVEKAQGADPVFADSREEPNVSLLSFHQLVPLPEEVLKGPYCRKGYDAEFEYWGVKWGARDVCREHEPGEPLAEYRFQTPWSFPEEFLRRVSMKFPELNFDLEYEEPNMEMFGRIEFQNGIVLRQFDWESEEVEAEERRHLAREREGTLRVSLLQKSPFTFGPLRGSQLEWLGEEFYRRTVELADATEKLESDGWICGVNEQYVLFCCHREVKTRKELEKRVSSLGLNKILGL